VEEVQLLGPRYRRQEPPLERRPREAVRQGWDWDEDHSASARFDPQDFRTID